MTGIIVKGRSWKSRFNVTRDSDMVSPTSPDAIVEYRNDNAVVIQYLRTPIYLGSVKVGRYTIHNVNGDVSYRYARTKQLTLSDSQLLQFEKNDTIELYAPARILVENKWHAVLVFHDCVVGKDFVFSYGGEQTPTPHKTRSSENPGHYLLTEDEQIVETNIKQQIKKT